MDPAITDTQVDRPGTADEGPGPTFADLGTSEPIRKALADHGITHAFPIQALAVPIVLEGHDIIAQARTGTGKTLAFGIPILQRLADTGPVRPKSPHALVVVPTRELAIQVAADLSTAAEHLGTKIVTLYGGRAYEPQIDALHTADVVVGTPGRLLDLARQGHLDLSDARMLVLDEADKMLDLGFLPDVEKILQLCSGPRQTMLFSATMPGEVVTLARRHLQQPMHVRAEQHGEPAHVPLTEQHVFRAHRLDKIEMLARLLQAEGRGLVMVFCRTRRSADQVSETLTTKGFASAAVHGDLGQAQRERALRAFRAGKVDVLVATDVAARGLDVDDVTHVVNYECPEDDKAYLHRIGRTGRAGRTGIAVTFIDWDDIRRWQMINETLSLGHPDPPETYSTSEHFFAAMAIPAGATGRLPTAQRDRAGLAAEEIEDLGETGRTRSPSRRKTRSGPDRGQRASSGAGGSGGGRTDRARHSDRAGSADRTDQNGRGERAGTATSGRVRKRRRRSSGGASMPGGGSPSGERQAASGTQGSPSGRSPEPDNGGERSGTRRRVRRRSTSAAEPRPDTAA